MQNLAQFSGPLSSRADVIISAFDLGLLSLFNLEGYLDAIEQDERGGLWW